jgi:hypothetical protein
MYLLGLFKANYREYTGIHHIQAVMCIAKIAANILWLSLFSHSKNAYSLLLEFTGLTTITLVLMLLLYHHFYNVYELRDNALRAPLWYSTSILGNCILLGLLQSLGFLCLIYAVADQRLSILLQIGYSCCTVIIEFISQTQGCSWLLFRVLIMPIVALIMLTIISIDSLAFIPYCIGVFLLAYHHQYFEQLLKNVSITYAIVDNVTSWGQILHVACYSNLFTVNFIGLLFAIDMIPFVGQSYDFGTWSAKFTLDFHLLILVLVHLISMIPLPRQKKYWYHGIRGATVLFTLVYWLIAPTWYTFTTQELCVVSVCILFCSLAYVYWISATRDSGRSLEELETPLNTEGSMAAVPITDTVPLV